MVTNVTKREMLDKAVNAIRDNIKCMQNYALKGNLGMYRRTLTELLAYNDLLNRIGMYDQNGRKMIHAIIMKHCTTPRRVMLYRLGGKL